MRFGNVVTTNSLLHIGGTLHSLQEIEDNEFFECTLCNSGTCQDTETFEFQEARPACLLRPDNFSYAVIISPEGLSPLTTIKKGDLWDYSAPLPAESAFEERDEIKENKIKVIINDLRNNANIFFAHEIANKLDKLYEIVNEDPDEDIISVDSIVGFVAFLKDNPNLKCPDVSLAPSNEIHAQWRVAPNRHFGAIFLSNGETQFVVFKPNSINPTKTDRIWGTTSVDALIQTVLPHNVLEWAANE